MSLLKFHQNHLNTLGVPLTQDDNLKMKILRNFQFLNMLVAFVLETFYMVEHARDKNISFITNAAVDYILTVFAIVKVYSTHHQGKSVKNLVKKLEDLTKNSKKLLNILENVKT
jgi:hypothetical protein